MFIRNNKKEDKDLKVNYTNHFLQRYVERMYNISSNESEKYVKENRSSIVKLANDLLEEMELIYSGYTKLNEKECSNYYIKNNWIIITSQNINRNGILGCSAITIYKLSEEQEKYINKLTILYKKKNKLNDTECSYRKELLNEKIKKCLNSIKYFCNCEKNKHIEALKDAINNFELKNNTEIYHAEENQGVSLLEEQLLKLGITKPEVSMTYIRTMDDTVTWKYPKTKARKYCRA